VVNLAKSAAAPPTPAFSPTDLQFLNTLMTHIAYAVDNARLLQEAQLSANGSAARWRICGRRRRAS